MKKIVSLIAAAAVLMVAFANSADAKRASQAPLKIAGKVVEKESGTSLEFVTVALRDSSDAVVAAATTDTTGTFSFSVPYRADIETLAAEFSLIGYLTVRVPAEKLIASDGTSGVVSSAASLYGTPDGTASANVGGFIEGTSAVVELQPDSQMLESAKVTGKRELLEHKFDKIVMNVSELAVAQTGNANDVLRSAPGVTIDKDGNIQLNGQTVAVWIDGKPSNMSGKELQSYLNGSSGTSIEKVEIISNPSSKYDAEGSGGIIDIKTKRDFMRGFNGSVSAQASAGWTPRANGNADIGIRLGYKGEKTNTTLSYSPYGGTWNGDSLEEKRYGEDNSNFRRTDTNSDTYWLGHNISLMEDWKVSDKDVLGAIVRIGISEGGAVKPYHSKTSDYLNVPADGNIPDDPHSVLDGTSSDKRNENRVSANLNYTRKFDESKSQELTLNADYNRSSNDAWSWQRNRYVELSSAAQALKDADPSLFTDNGRNDSTFRVANIFSLKADYSQNFWKQTGRIEAGFKAAVSITDNDYDAYRWDPETDISTVGERMENNEFRYTEQIYAAYINVAKQFSEKWNAQVGVRGEMTVPKGLWKSEDKVSGKPYFDVFPTAFLTYIPSPKAILSVNYSYRLSRPKYWQLNPFRNYINPYSYSVGNPDLLPSYTHDVSLSSVFFSRMTLSVGYYSTKNHNEQQIPVTNESGVTSFEYANSGIQRTTYVSLALSELPITKWWTLTTNLFYGYTTFNAYKDSAEKLGFTNYRTASHGFNFYGNTTFYLPAEFKIDVGGWVMTPQTVSYYKIKTMGSLDASVTKTFLDGRINLTLGMRDILNTQFSDLSVTVNGVQTVRLKSYGNGRMINFGFTYSFGQAVSSRRNVGNTDESSRL